MKDDWKSLISRAAEERGKLRVVPWSLCREIALSEGLPPREVERWACENGIVPSRYERSIGTLGLEGKGALTVRTVDLRPDGLKPAQRLGRWMAVGVAGPDRDDRDLRADRVQERAV